MVLHLDGEALFLRIEARPLGERPTLEHPSEFQAQIVVEASGSVLLNKIKTPGRAFRELSLRLCSPGKIAFTLVGIEFRGLPVRHGRPIRINGFTAEPQRSQRKPINGFFSVVSVSLVSEANGW
jgi:hypothetical protein